MPNIELKAHCNDPARAVAVLQQHGASVVRDHVETDTYFAVPEGRLKYRESPVRDSRLIAYFRTDQRTQRDSHFQIAATEPGVHVIKSVLTRALGVRAVVTKRRVTLEHPHGWLANVDRFVDHTFVELEFEYTTPDQRATSETTMALVKDSLGIRDEDILPWSYELVGSLITRSASWREQVPGWADRLLVLGVPGERIAETTAHFTRRAGTPGSGFAATRRYASGIGPDGPEASVTFEHLLYSGEFVEFDHDPQTGHASGIRWDDLTDAFATGRRVLTVVDEQNLRHVRAWLPGVATTTAGDRVDEFMTTTRCEDTSR